MARRFFIFSIGLLFGSVMVYQVLIKGTDREFYGSWLPEGRVLKKLRTGLDKQYVRLNCLTKCAGIFNSDIDALLENGDVDFSASVTKGREKRYVISTELAAGDNLTVEFDRIEDSISISKFTLGTKTVLAKECDCD